MYKESKDWGMVYKESKGGESGVQGIQRIVYGVQYKESEGGESGVHGV